MSRRFASAPLRSCASGSMCIRKGIMMKTDDLENELRNLKLLHLSESELAAYCDQELGQIRRARMEAHLKQCFICERQLALLREESAALSKREISVEDVALVERLMEQMGLTAKASAAAARVAEIADRVPMHERLAEYLQQMVESWRIFFRQGARRGGFRQEMRRGGTNQGEEVWR